MKRETTANKVGASITTVIPSVLVDLLGIHAGDKLIWDVEISEKGISIDLYPKK